MCASRWSRVRHGVRAGRSPWNWHTAGGTCGLVIEVTDGTSEANTEFRRGVGFYYDLVKANVDRIVKGLNAELSDHPVTAVGVTPGWLRSEQMLEKFGVTEDTWREACVKTPGFAISESPAYVGRGVAALATTTARELTGSADQAAMPALAAVGLDRRQAACVSARRGQAPRCVSAGLPAGSPGHAALSGP